MLNSTKNQARFGGRYCPSKRRPTKGDHLPNRVIRRREQRSWMREQAA